jgi:archaemetzincin
LKTGNIFFALLFVLSLFACNQEKSGVNQLSQSDENKVTIIIQTFDEFPENETQTIAVELRKVYSKVTINKNIPFPSNSLNSSGKRYRADSLIKYLSKQASKNTLIIGLTNKDISTQKGEIKDWGVFGLGYCPGKSCIASNFRLKGKNRAEKLYKVAIHELGHTQGLPHCPIKTCLMRDAKGKDVLDEEKEFCNKCKQVLINANWAFK